MMKHHGMSYGLRIPVWILGLLLLAPQISAQPLILHTIRVDNGGTWGNPGDDQARYVQMDPITGYEGFSAPILSGLELELLPNQCTFDQKRNLYLFSARVAPFGLFEPARQQYEVIAIDPDLGRVKHRYVCPGRPLLLEQDKQNQQLYMLIHEEDETWGWYRLRDGQFQHLLTWSQPTPTGAVESVCYDSNDGILYMNVARGRGDHALWKLHPGSRTAELVEDPFPLMQLVYDHQRRRIVGFTPDQKTLRVWYPQSGNDEVIHSIEEPWGELLETRAFDMERDLYCITVMHRGRPELRCIPTYDNNLMPRRIPLPKRIHAPMFDNLAFTRDFYGLLPQNDPLYDGATAELRLYPNPNPGTLQVVLPEAATWLIRDRLGRLVVQDHPAPVGRTPAELDLDSLGLSPGLYTFLAESRRTGKRYVRKFIVY